MFRAPHIVLYLVFLLGHSASAFDLIIRPAMVGSEVEVRGATSQPIEAEPGAVVTAVFSVRNTSDKTQSYRASVDLPTGWLLVGVQERFQVEAGETVRRIISFRVAGSTPVGSFPVGYTVTAVNEETVYDRGSITVLVGEVRHFDIEFIDAPDWAWSSSEFDVSMIVTNAGNAPARIRLDIESQPSSVIRASFSDLLDFGPAERRRLTITVTAVAASTRRHRQWLRVKAWVGNELAGESATSVDILPSARPISAAGRIPATLTVNGFSSERGRGAQVELEGRGAIREGGDHMVDFGIRAPDRSTSSLFARRDMVRLAYVASSWAVLLGDQRFSVSPLTEYGRQSRGIGVTGNVGSIEATAFVSRSRYSLPRENVFGLNLTYAAGQVLRLGANVVDKTGIVSGSSVTVRSEIEPVSNVLFDVEVGDGGGFDASSSAFAAGVSARRSLGDLDVRYMRSGADFPGLYQDRSLASATMHVTPGKGFSVGTTVRRDERRLPVSVGGGSLVQNTYARSGPAYSFHLGRGRANLGAALEYRSQKAVIGGQDESRSLQTGEITAGLEVGTAGVQASFEVGSVAASFSDSALPMTRLEVMGHLSFGSIAYSAAVELRRGATMYRLTSSRSALVSNSIQGSLGNRVSWRIEGLMMVDDAFRLSRYQSLGAYTEIRLPVGHTLTVSSQLSGFAGEPVGHDVGVSYKVPLGLPSLHRSGPRVRGRVVDAVSGSGVSDVVVRVGTRAARSDSDGRFAVEVADVGEQYLVVDAASIGLDRIVLVETPIKLDVESRRSDLLIPIIEAASIDGVVNRYEYGSGSLQSGSLVAASGEAGVVVEFSDGIGRFRASTGPDGRFRSVRIRPGTWTARIVYAGLPESHVVGEQVTVHVPPGGAVTVELRTVPRRRQIRFVARGILGDKPDSTDQLESTAAADSLTSPESSSAELESSSPDSQKQPPAFESDSTASRSKSTDSEPEPVRRRVDSRCKPATNLPLRHTIRHGETLTRIAARYYCDPVKWPAVWFANVDAIPNPHVVLPGHVVDVLIPAVVLDYASLPNKLASKLHTLKEGETLQSLADRYYGNRKLWPRIWMANRTSFGDAPTPPAGAVLRIPGSARFDGERRVVGAGDR